MGWVVVLAVGVGLIGLPCVVQWAWSASQRRKEDDLERDARFGRIAEAIEASTPDEAA
jgi:hypothetical protein